MTIEEKNLILKEIKNSSFNSLLILSNIKETSLYEIYKDLILSEKIDLDGTLLEKFVDDKIGKKILIENKYGILGNLLYKYRKNLDEEIIYEMYKKDLSNITKLLYVVGGLDCYDFDNELINFIQELIWNLDKKIVNRLLYDKDFFMDDLTVSWWKFARDELKNDKYYVLNMIKEIKKDENELLYTGDKCFVLDRSELIEKILLYTGDELKSDKDFINTILYNNDNSIRLFKYLGISSKDYVIESLRNNIEVFKYLDDCYTKNIDFILEVIKFNVNVLKYVDIGLKQDKDFMLKVIECNEKAFKYIGKKLKEDEKFIKMVNELKIKNDNKDNCQLSLEF